MRLYKYIALIALFIIACYMALVWFSATYVDYAHYYIEQHCDYNIDINHSNNENDAKDIYYICEDWSK